MPWPHLIPKRKFDVFQPNCKPTPFLQPIWLSNPSEIAGQATQKVPPASIQHQSICACSYGEYSLSTLAITALLQARHCHEYVERSRAGVRVSDEPASIRSRTIGTVNAFGTRYQTGNLAPARHESPRAGLTRVGDQVSIR